MKFFMLAGIFFYVLSAEGMNQKMVISSHKSTAEAANDLYKIEKYFEENPQAKKLKTQYQLVSNLELLEPYVLVTITPITSGELKNKLRYLLQSVFPKNFVVHNTYMQTAPILPVKKKPEVVDRKVSMSTPLEKDDIGTSTKIRIFLGGLESEWLGLVLLALAGFLLVYRSAKQMNKIKQLQEEVIQYQSKVEGEIKHMGDKDA